MSPALQDGQGNALPTDSSWRTVGRSLEAVESCRRVRLKILLSCSGCVGTLIPGLEFLGFLFVCLPFLHRSDFPHVDLAPQDIYKLQRLELQG